MSKARFTQHLDTLDTLYRFAGGRGGPGEVDIERPISLVHDVAPDVGRLASRLLVEDIGLTNTAATITWTTRTKADILFDAAALGGSNPQAPIPVNQFDVWLLDAVMMILEADKANIAGCFLTIQAPIEEGSGQHTSVATGNMLVRYWDTAFGAFNAEAPNNTFEPMYSDGAYPGLLARLPRRIGSLHLRTNAGAGGDAAYQCQYVAAITPKGVLPPALTGWT